MTTVWVLSFVTIPLLGILRKSCCDLTMRPHLFPRIQNQPVAETGFEHLAGATQRVLT